MGNLLPGGTITLLFTDIEGSTRLWEEFPEAMRPALAHHGELLQQTILECTRTIFKTVGDAFCAAFSPRRMQSLRRIDFITQFQDDDEEWLRNNPRSLIGDTAYEAAYYAGQTASLDAVIDPLL